MGGLLTRFLYAGLEGTGATAFMRSVRDAAVVLCYHNVEARSSGTDSGAPGAHMAVDRFHNQMRWLLRHYEVLPLTALVDRMCSGESLRRAASVTFDDGYAGVFEYAWPVLRELGIPATVFIVANAPGRTAPFWWDRESVRRALTDRRRRQWLTGLRGDEEEILQSLASDPDVPGTTAPARLPAAWPGIAQAVREGMDLGVHSTTHRALPSLSDEELDHEIETARVLIAREVGVTPSFFAFPYGLWNERVRTRVQQAGYRAAFTLDYGLLRSSVDRWALPRINVPAAIRGPAFRAWTAGLNLRHPLSV